MQLCPLGHVSLRILIMNFTDLIRLFISSWADINEDPEPPLPPLPFKKGKVKRNICSVPLGIKRKHTVNPL